MINLLRFLPVDMDREHFETLLEADRLRVELIVSRGQASPEQGWYDQALDEWVVVLTGQARLAFEDEAREVSLGPGDHLTIAAHRRHRVTWTAPDIETRWLAIHFAASGDASPLD
ncbi:cupin domain-containing protein [Halomonas organivorans]|uniref:Cupin 2 domain-containing protein n=1 Tax=Halomonas organivorans TaxID=257772 RepID=A0A7W5BZX0_9GAMM|nr:cupin domain-containing protein [Halomonas organivorans]MBB3142072.1 cupin 2 domain-containing protein [Halomonas organivorans]